jgi:hypothetical protein
VRAQAAQHPERVGEVAAQALQLRGGAEEGRRAGGDLPQQLDLDDVLAGVGA